MSDQKEKKYVYKNKIEWIEAKKGVLSSKDKPDLKIAVPPEFKGHPNIWSPEDLFVASINICIMTTFLYYADLRRLDFKSYEGDAEGILEYQDGRLRFTEVKIYPRIKVKETDDIEKARKCMENSEGNCLISNSIKTNVEVIPEIKVAS